MHKFLTKLFIVNNLINITYYLYHYCYNCHNDKRPFLSIYSKCFGYRYSPVTNHASSKEMIIELSVE